ncbi:tetratricopeptide repeat protein, partial [candidate division KSB1 bacterium]|nr:tetratricopeptide repeat protein [candidate division KSB1 bacterium]
MFAISPLTLPLVQAQESSVVAAILEEASGDITILDELLSEHEALLNKYPNSEFAPTLMFQLAELHYERSQLVFQKEMATYEEQLSAFQKGELTQEPHMPSLSMDKTIFYCSALIEKYPAIKYRDKVIYKLATAYMDAGDQDNAKANFELLTQNYPNSPIALEAHFRIGEYLFDHRLFDEAVNHYQVLLSQWDNPYYSMALYKLGWTYYNLTEYAKAISTFLALIEDMNIADGLVRANMTQVDLRTESIHYIASSFTEHGGTALAKGFLAPMKEKEYTPAILIKMAELYENRNTYS